jgi:hypothetical protein
MEDSEMDKSVIRAANLACESKSASLREVTVDSMVVCGLSLTRYDDGEKAMLAGLAPLLSLSGVKILSKPSLPARHNKLINTKPCKICKKEISEPYTEEKLNPRNLNHIFLN